MRGVLVGDEADRTSEVDEDDDDDEDSDEEDEESEAEVGDDSDISATGARVERDEDAVKTAFSGVAEE